MTEVSCKALPSLDMHYAYQQYANHLSTQKIY